MGTREYLQSQLRELEELRNGDLREKVLRVWMLAMERGGWERLDDFPFTLLIPTRVTILEHTSRVTRMALDIARRQGIDNTDNLVAAGLLHDVGKLLEYEKVDGEYRISAFGKKVRHPVSGFHLALEAGMPLEVAHAIMMHSTDVQKIERSPEAIILYHCDFIDFELEKARLSGERRSS